MNRMRNGVHLIVYADRFGDGGFQGLEKLISGPLADVVTGMHILPFFTPYDGADAGFDPSDHKQVDPRLGTWEHLSRLSKLVDITADLIVNHISDGSPEFLDYLATGDASPYRDLFLTFDKVFPQGAKESDLAAIFRPRPTLPFTWFPLQDGSQRLLWTTFSEHQVDIDVNGSIGQNYLISVLEKLQAAGVAQVRMDAVGFTVKTAGTSCFLTPETIAFIDWLQGHVKARGMETLLELHAHPDLLVQLASHVDRVYDFALPPLVLQLVLMNDPTPLARWLAVRPTNVVTVLDTHDGIGVHDAGAYGDVPGLLDDNMILALQDAVHRATGGESREASGTAASNLDTFQINTTFFSAVGCDPLLYFVARLVQLFVPGLPQVYYVGLIAAANDMELLQSTRVGRDINRHRVTSADFTTALSNPLVGRLLWVLRWRSCYSAFSGEFSSSSPDARSLEMRWDHGDQRTTLHISMSPLGFEWRFTEGEGEERVFRSVEDVPVLGIEPAAAHATP